MGKERSYVTDNAFEKNEGKCHHYSRDFSREQCAPFCAGGTLTAKSSSKKRELYFYIVQSENSIYYENYSWNSLRLVQNKHITAISNRGGEDSFKHFSNL